MGMVEGDMYGVRPRYEVKELCWQMRMPSSRAEAMATGRPQ